MNTKQLKRQLILNIPYIILGLAATNFGEAWRIASGLNASEKVQSIVLDGTFATAFSNPMPSFHPMDLLVGIACGAALRLAVYLKGKNAKKFKGVLVSGIMDNLTNTFSSVNDQVGQIATEVGKTPSNYLPAVFNMVKNLSETVIMPVAGILLTFIACYELIQLIISYNNLASFETWFIWKWIFKTFVAVELITHTFDITMAVFDVSQRVVQQAGGLIQGSTAIDASTLASMQTTLEAMELGPLLAIFLQSFIVQFLMYVLAAIIFVIINGRMIEIYLMVSLAPIPFATFGNREQSMMGQNYLRSLFALGFQGFLIMVCVGIYAVLIQSVAFSSDIIGSLWKVMGFTILLAFTLFKTGAVAHSIFHAH